MTLTDTRQGLSGLDYFRKMMAGEMPPPAMLELMNIRLVEVDEGRVVFSALAEERFYNGTGVAHGGFDGVPNGGRQGPQVVGRIIGGLRQA